MTIPIVEGRALNAQQKKDLLNRLARVEGQLRGVQKLIALADAPSDCDAVAQQMAAARKALDRSFVQLLTSSMLNQSNNAATLEDAQASAARLAASESNSSSSSRVPPQGRPKRWASSALMPYLTRRGGPLGMSCSPERGAASAEA